MRYVSKMLFTSSINVSAFIFKYKSHLLPMLLLNVVGIVKQRMTDNRAVAFTTRI